MCIKQAKFVETITDLYMLNKKTSIELLLFTF